MDELMATIKLFAGDFTPKGYLECNGALLPIASYNALYSLLGTVYGGDGINTFALPDLRSRVPVGIGTGPGLSNYVLGQKSGTENNILLTSNLPAHSHTATLNVNSGNSDVSVPVTGASIATPGSVPARSFVPTLGFNNAAPNVSLNPASVQVNAAGSSFPVNNLQPYLGLRYIICNDGLYPQRP